MWSATETIDEMNATLGLARASAKHPWVLEKIADTQKDLIDVMAELATDAEDMEHYRETDGLRVTDEAMVDRLSEWVRELETDHKVNFKKWSTPGAAGSVAGAGLDLARTVCRRAERLLVGLIDDGQVENRAILRYLNRMSDVLWLLARLEERGSED